jgi:hypothetical protein
MATTSILFDPYSFSLHIDQTPAENGTRGGGSKSTRGRRVIIMKRNHVVGAVCIFAVAFLSLPALTNGATVYYDSFSRTGGLEGSSPNTTANGNTWTEMAWWNGAYPSGGYITLNGSYAPSGNASSTAGAGGFLPVNGSSGVTLDGTKSFTVSADAWSTSGDVSIFAGGYSLDISSAGAVNVSVPSTYLGGTGAGLGTFPLTSHASPVNLEIVYDATTQQTTFEINGTSVGSPWWGPNPFAASTAPSDAISNVNKVGFYFNSGTANPDTGGIDNFTLSVTSVPEPASFGLLGVTGIALLMRRRSQK